MKKSLVSFRIIQQARKKALHMLCKKYAQEGGNSEYHDFGKINELSFAVRDKLISIFIVEKLLSYSHTYSSFSKYSRNEKKTSRRASTFIVKKISNGQKIEIPIEVQFSLFREPRLGPFLQTNHE